MADGKVCIGFSQPYVATYACSSGTISYTGCRKLARGISVEVSPDSNTDSNDFSADNVLAESISGVFTGGSLSLTVDGLLMESKRFIYGLPAAGTDGWTAFDDNQDAPYVGFGFISEFMSDGVKSWVPTVLVKCRFEQPTTSAETQEWGEDVSWQTQELSAKILRGDDANHTWLYEGAGFNTEALALAALKTKLGYVAPANNNQGGGSNEGTGTGSGT